MTTKEKIEIMQAYVDGKQIQFKKNGESRWIDVNKKSSLLWDWAEYDYRIKPEPKEPTYRPYKDFAEFKADWDKHGGWAKHRSGNITLISLYATDYLQCYLEEYAWADDGSPCGVPVEEGGE